MFITFKIERQEFDPSEWDMDGEVTMAPDPDSLYLLVTEEVTSVEMSFVSFLGGNGEQRIKIVYKHGGTCTDALGDISHEWFVTPERPDGAVPIHVVYDTGRRR